jgi:hypothetical protein
MRTFGLQYAAVIAVAFVGISQRATAMSVSHKDAFAVKENVN